MDIVKQKVRVVFMGTPEIATYPLKALIEEGYDLVGVITNPDKPFGRKNILTPPPVKLLALEHGIPVFQPAKIRLDNSFLPPLNADVIVTMAYGQIVPKEVLEAPKKGCLNLHGSILPKYRGAAPMQRAIINGEQETGVSLMKMVEAMDAGCVYDVERFPILENDDYGSIYKKMGEAAARIIVKDLPLYLAGELNGAEQDESKVTFAPKITPEEERLNLTSAIKFLRHVHALSPEPGGYLYLGEEKIKILGAEMRMLPSLGEDGVILDAGKKLLVGFHDGVVEITRLHPSNKKPMSGRDFCNGHKDLVGRKLS